MSFDMKLLSCFFTVLKALKKTPMKNQVLNADKKIESLTNNPQFRISTEMRHKQKGDC